MGTGPRGGVDTAAAAALFKVSPRTVQRWLAGTATPTDEAAVNAKAMAAAAFGTGPRGGVNAAAPAAQLGVSRSTVYRWLRGTLPAARAEQLRQAATAAAQDSPVGRAGATRSFRASLKNQMRRDPRTGLPRPEQRQTARLMVKGVQDVASGARRTLTRDRTIRIPLSPAHVDGLFDTWEQGGADAALDYIENAASALYMEEDLAATPEDLADEDYLGKNWYLNSIESINWSFE